MKSKSNKKSGFHLDIGDRILGLILCILAGLFVLFAWNYTYNKSSNTNRQQMTRVRKGAVKDVPDYHPRKSTKGTRAGQDTESSIKQQINKAK